MLDRAQGDTVWRHRVDPFEPTQNSPSGETLPSLNIQPTPLGIIPGSFGWWIIRTVKGKPQLSRE